MTKQRRPGRYGSQSAPGRLRIVAGKWRGRFLPVTDAPGLRPTSERIRETLFNWLAPVVEGTRCLDLFAGTGVLGLEALSRGAAEAVFVERSRPVAAALRQNIAALGADTATLHVTDSFSWLRDGAARRFDVVFLDPPYALESLAELCRLLVARPWLAPGALLYLEQDSRHDRPRLPQQFEFTREKTAGSVRYSLVKAPAAREV